MGVSVTLRGRLGNNLCQYAVGRVLAEAGGLALDCCSATPPESIAPNSASLHGLTRYFSQAPLHISGRRITSPTVSFTLGSTNGWKGQRIPFRRLSSSSGSTALVLDGHFQRMEYFSSHLLDIAQWYEPIAAYNRYSPSPGDVVMTFRRDIHYGWRGWILPMSYYDAALSLLRPMGQLFCCAWSPDVGLLEHFSQYNPVWLRLTPLEEFCFVRQFRRIVLSNSTCPWWSSLLSSATTILAPRAATGTGYAFTGFPDVDLHMRQRRYREIAVGVFSTLHWTAHSKIVGASLYTVDEDVLIQRAGMPTVTISMPSSARPLLAALTQLEILTPQVLQITCRSEDQYPLLNRLVRHDIIDLRARYHEPD